MLLSLVSRVPYNFEDGSPPSSLSKTRYYMPRATTNPTFDSSFVRKGELYAFQMTKRDGANEKGLEAIMKLKNKVSGCNFVYVIPKGPEAKLFCVNIPSVYVNDFKFYFLQVDIATMQLPVFL